MRRTLIWLNLYGCQAVWHRKKRAKSALCVFLALFWAYVGQSDDHIGWTTLMPVASIYRTNQRINPWKKNQKKWELGELKISDFLTRMGQNFDNHPGFQPKTTFMYYFAHDCSSRSHHEILISCLFLKYYIGTCIK